MPLKGFQRHMGFKFSAVAILLCRHLFLLIHHILTQHSILITCPVFGVHYRVGKENTQKIESKHINLRTRIKRLVRRTICFSKTEHMHDLVIGLFINRYEFGRAV
jgi:hypothetical protein